MTPDKVEEFRALLKQTCEVSRIGMCPGCGLTLEGLDDILTQHHQDLMSEVLPFLKAYEQALECDWSINPVQATNSVYRSPESVLRDRADDIERKREMLGKLKTIIKSLSK